MTVRRPFTWNEIEMWTLPDLLMTMLLAVDTQEEADDFMESYAELFEDEPSFTHAVRYAVSMIALGQPEGAGDEDEAARLYDLFGVDPVGSDEVLAPVQTFGRASCGMLVNI